MLALAGQLGGRGRGRHHVEAIVEQCTLARRHVALLLGAQGRGRRGGAHWRSGAFVSVYGDPQRNPADGHQNETDACFVCRVRVRVRVCLLVGWLVEDRFCFVFCLVSLRNMIRAPVQLAI